MHYVLADLGVPLTRGGTVLPRARPGRKTRLAEVLAPDFKHRWGKIVTRGTASTSLADSQHEDSKSVR
jgi:hypothetical protein